MGQYLYKSLIVLLALIVPVTSGAYNFQVDGIYYNKNGNELEVTYKSNSSSVHTYSGEITIPETVTYNDETFTVTSIGDKAFYRCDSLTRVFLPNSVTSIGAQSFGECTSMDSIRLSDNLISIGSSAFYSCKSLRTIDLPESLITLGGGAFSTCSSLTDVVIPNSVTELGSNVFFGCDSLRHVVIGNSIPKIPDYAFYRSPSLTSVVLGSSVTEIGNFAFCECTNLVSVSLPESLKKIMHGAFRECQSLSDIEFPNSLTMLGDHSFYNCKSLTRIVIPDSVHIIPVYAFNECKSLKDVTLGNNVDTIRYRAFCSCISLKQIDLPNTLKYIDGSAFYECDSLLSVTIPNSVTYMGSSAFSRCDMLTDVVIGDSLKIVPEYAFYEDPSLANVTIGKSVETIKSRAFLMCTALSKFNFNAKRCTLIDMYTFTKGIDIVSVGEGVEYIPSGFPYFANEKKKLILPNSVQVIEKGALRGKFNAIVFGNGIDSIATGAISQDSTFAYVTTFDPVPCDSGAFTHPHTLYVPSGSFMNYVEAQGWREFPNIIEYDFVQADSIALDVNNFKLAKGATRQLIPSIMPEDASSDMIAWLSTRPGVATVSADGIVTGIENGETDIIAMIDNAQAVCHVVVTDGVVETLSINKGALSLLVDDEFTLYATVTPDSAWNKTVEWIIPRNNVLMTQELENNSLYIRALRAGTVTVTAHTTDGSNLYAECVINVDNYSDNAFYVPELKGLRGDVVTIPVSLCNVDPIVAFQTDICLPEGFSVLIENDDYAIIPSDRMAEDHTILANLANNGAVRVVCYTPSEQVFTGEPGDVLFYVKVAIPDDAVGNYTVSLKNSRLTSSSLEEIRVPVVNALLKVDAFMPGDANYSHTVTVTDIVVTAQYILDLNPDPFVFAAADMNGDGSITVTDIMLIANLIRHPSASAPRHAPALISVDDRMHSEGLSVMAGQTGQVSVMLDNALEYCAFQFDMHLPAGLQVDDISLSDRAGQHNIEMNTLHDGVVRVLCYTPDFQPIVGNSGALLSLDATALGLVTGDILVDGVEMVTTDCQTVNLDSFTIPVSGTTAVGELSAAIRIYADGQDIIIESPVAQQVVISDAAGHSWREKVIAGRNVIHTPGQGIYMVNASGQTAKLMLK